MKKRSKKRHIRFKTTESYHSRKRPIIEMEPEEAVTYVRRAEKEVLPMIKQMHIPPAPAFFLLAQYAQAFMTDDPRLSVESATEITNTVLTLWQTGKYTPSSDYPYTLEQTLHDAHNDHKTTHEYAASFQPFISSTHTIPRGRGEIAAGLVRHPETQLWQVWMILDGPCDYIGAYSDLEKAQHALGLLIDAIRRGVARNELDTIYAQVISQSKADPQQIPFPMMQYLLEHIDQYTLSL